MAATTIHIAKWGARQVPGASTYGVVTSLERIEDSMTQTETDEQGAVCRVVRYDRRTRVAFCVQASATAKPPKSGENMSVDGIQGWVMNAEVVEQNQAFKKIRVTLETYENCNTLG